MFESKAFEVPTVVDLGSIVAKTLGQGALTAENGGTHTGGANTSDNGLSPSDPVD